MQFGFGNIVLKNLPAGEYSASVRAYGKNMPVDGRTMTMTTYGASEEVVITDLESKVINEIEESGAAKSTSNADGTVNAKHVLNSKGQLLVSLSKAKGKEVRGELDFGLVDLKKIPWGFENNFGWRNQQKSVQYKWLKVDGQWK